MARKTTNPIIARGGKVRGQQDLHPNAFRPSKPNFPEELRTEQNRPVGPGPAHRGDRRDMNKAYTNNRRTQANHTNPKSGRGHSTGK